LCEIALLLAGRDGTVDGFPELEVAEVADAVVGLDVLLDGLATRAIAFFELYGAQDPSAKRVAADAAKRR